MRITFITHMVSAREGDSAGGAQRSIHTLAVGLQDRGHDVTIVTLRSADNELGTVDYQIVEERDQLPGLTERLDRLLPDVCRKYDAETDCFHAFGPHFVPGVARYRRTGDTPVVGRLNAYSTFCYNTAKMDGQCHETCSVRKRFQHFDGSAVQSAIRVPQMAYAEYRTALFDHVDHLCAISPAAKRIYEEVGVSDTPISITPNMYDPEFVGEEPVDVDFPADATNVLFVGRLSPEKGVGLLIEACARASTSLTLHVVGDGPAQDALESTAATADVDCVFHGRVDYHDLYWYYRAADCFVHPGLWPEPAGRIVLESLLAETPLIVSDLGGPPWIAGDACLTFERGDLDGLADRLDRLATDDDLRAELVRATRTELSRFESAEVLDRYEAVYDGV